MSSNKFYSLSGVIGALVLFFNIVLFTIITPGYNSFWQTISELNSIGSANFLAINVLYTLGFSLLLFSSNYYLSQKQTSSRVAGSLMIISFLIMIILNWFFPMDPRLNIRTSEDLVHNNIITIAVVIFLLSQVFSLAYYSEIKINRLKNVTLYSFVLALFFGVLSLYSNIYKSELINIAERGWMLVFLLYLFITSRFMQEK